MRRNIATFVAIAFMLFAPRIRATEPSKPVLAVLLSSLGELDRAREARFINEIRVGMDGFEIAVVDPRSPNFSSLPLKDKLDRLKQLSEPLDAVASMWLESAGPDVVMLSVVALGTGRAFIRIVEIPSGPEAERELAVAAEELLGQIYMLSSASSPKPVQRTVEKVLEKASRAFEKGATMEWGASAFFAASGGVYPLEGTWARVGGGASLDFVAGSGWMVRAGFEVEAGPFDDPSDGSVSGYGLSPELEFGHLWALDRIRLGPVVSASAMRSSVATALGAGDAHTYSWWSFRGSLGFEVRLALGRGVALFVSPRLGVWSHTRKFERVSDGSTAFLTPMLDVGGLAGVRFGF